ncbi:MAG: hypothetical protein QM426_06355 [Euryarchaeota archaeon]|nr:hypothetical protein [Euryarchaeota archaeon]
MEVAWKLFQPCFSGNYLSIGVIKDIISKASCFNPCFGGNYFSTEVVILEYLEYKEFQSTIGSYYPKINKKDIENQ